MLGLPHHLSQAELFPGASRPPLAAGPREHGECAGVELGGLRLAADSLCGVGDQTFEKASICPGSHGWEEAELTINLSWYPQLANFPNTGSCNVGHWVLDCGHQRSYSELNVNNKDLPTSTIAALQLLG